MVAADVLSVESSVALEYFLPEEPIQVQVEYDSTEEVDILVDDES